MNQLTKIVEENNLEVSEQKTILSKFGDFEKIAEEWEEKAFAIKVTNADQLTEMAMAKEARKKFSQLRIDVEKARKAMKEQSLRKGQAIDAVAKFLQSLIKPIEDHLKEQEDFVKIQEAKRLEEERLEAQRKAEEERIAKEKAEKEEQERIRLENEKLKQEIKKVEKEKETEVKALKEEIKTFTAPKVEKLNGDRYLFSIEIYDNETKKNIVYEAFNTSSLLTIIVKLNEVLHKLSGSKMPSR